MGNFEKVLAYMQLIDDQNPDKGWIKLRCYADGSGQLYFTKDDFYVITFSELKNLIEQLEIRYGPLPKQDMSAEDILKREG